MQCAGLHVRATPATPSGRIALRLPDQLGLGHEQPRFQPKDPYCSGGLSADTAETSNTPAKLRLVWSPPLPHGKADFGETPAYLAGCVNVHTRVPVIEDAAIAASTSGCHMAGFFRGRSRQETRRR